MKITFPIVSSSGVEWCGAGILNYSAIYKEMLAPVPTFSQKSGAYNEVINLTANAENGYTIKYTTDNTIPTLTNGEVFDGTMTIDDSKSFVAVAGSVNVIGRSLQTIMSGSKTVAKVANVVSKLKGGYITKVKGIYSAFYTAIRRGIARATGYSISTGFSKAIEKTFSLIANTITNSRFKAQIEIITYLFSLGGWIALLVDAIDGKVDSTCYLW